METEDAVLLDRAKELQIILDSYLRHGLTQVDTQAIRDILDTSIPFESGI